MRRILVMITLLLLVLNIGCKDKKVDDETKLENENQQIENGESTLIGQETAGNSEDEMTDDSQNPEGFEQDNNITNPDGSGNDELNKEEDKDQVEFDAYPSVTEPIVFDPTMFEDAESLEIDDEEMAADIQEYLGQLYFNYYFESGLEEETGTITDKAMELYALSYIMQHEHHELKFDADTFRLYIPVKHVREIVYKFFYRNLDVYNSYEELGVEYKNDMYSVIVENGTWDVEVQVRAIFKMGDFTYRVTADIVDKEYSIIKEQIEAVIDETTDGYLILNYNVTEYVESEEE